MLLLFFISLQSLSFIYLNRRSNSPELLDERIRNYGIKRLDLGLDWLHFHLHRVELDTTHRWPESKRDGPLAH